MEYKIVLKNSLETIILDLTEALNWNNNLLVLLKHHQKTAHDSEAIFEIWSRQSSKNNWKTIYKTAAFQVGNWFDWKFGSVNKKW